MVAYLCAVNNPNDDLRLSRIINNPPRGIGATTIDRAQDLALQTGRSLWEIVEAGPGVPGASEGGPQAGPVHRDDGGPAPSVPGDRPARLL